MGIGLGGRIKAPSLYPESFHRALSGEELLSERAGGGGDGGGRWNAPRGSEQGLVLGTPGPRRPRSREEAPSSRALQGGAEVDDGEPETWGGKAVFGHRVLGGPGTLNPAPHSISTSPREDSRAESAGYGVAAFPFPTSCLLCRCPV